MARDIFKGLDKLVEGYHTEEGRRKPKKQIKEAKTRTEIRLGDKVYPIKDKEFLKGKVAGYDNEHGLEHVRTIKYSDGTSYKIYDSGFGNFGHADSCAVLDEKLKGDVPPKGYEKPTSVKGDWIWDEVRYDWYDRKTGTYYAEVKDTISEGIKEEDNSNLTTYWTIIKNRSFFDEFDSEKKALDYLGVLAEENPNDALRLFKIKRDEDGNIVGKKEEIILIDSADTEDPWPEIHRMSQEETADAFGKDVYDIATKKMVKFSDLDESIFHKTSKDLMNKIDKYMTKTGKGAVLDSEGKRFVRYDTEDKKLGDLIAKYHELLDKEENGKLKEALYGKNEIDEFFRLCDELGLETFGDLKDFADNNKNRMMVNKLLSKFDTNMSTDAFFETLRDRVAEKDEFEYDDPLNVIKNKDRKNENMNFMKYPKDSGINNSEVEQFTKMCRENHFLQMQTKGDFEEVMLNFLQDKNINILARDIHYDGSTSLDVEEIKNIIKNYFFSSNESMQRKNESLDGINAKNSIEVEVKSGINGDGFKIIVKDTDGNIIEQDDFSYGYNASYNKSWADKDKPFVTDIINSYLSKYNLSKDDLILTKGKNTFKDTDVSDDTLSRFKTKYLSEGLTESADNSHPDFVIEDGILNKYNGNESNVVIPNDVTIIGRNAFRNCLSITSIIIPNSVTRIGRAAFYDCDSLTSVEIPDSVESIGDYAFDGCTALTSATIGDSVTRIGDCAFYGCKSLTSVTIGSSVTTIGHDAFGSCWSLTSIEIPDSVTRIGDYAFEDCTSFTSIEIPNSVTSIGNNAFWYCDSLTSIKIPNSVTRIGPQVFYNCPNLSKITYIGTKKESIECGIGDVSNTRWRNGSAIKKIICTDGVIDVETKSKHLDESKQLTEGHEQYDYKGFSIDLDDDQFHNIKRHGSGNIQVEIKIGDTVYATVNGYDAAEEWIDKNGQKILDDIAAKNKKEEEQNALINDCVKRVQASATGEHYATFGNDSGEAAVDVSLSKEDILKAAKIGSGGVYQNIGKGTSIPLSMINGFELYLNWDITMPNDPYLGVGLYANAINEDDMFKLLGDPALIGWYNIHFIPESSEEVKEFWKTEILPKANDIAHEIVENSWRNSQYSNYDGIYEALVKEDSIKINDISSVKEIQKDDEQTWADNEYSALMKKGKPNWDESDWETYHYIQQLRFDSGYYSESLKEEYGPYKDNEVIRAIGEQIADGNDYGSAYDRDWELKIYAEAGEVIENENVSSDFYSRLLADISYPVLDGHLDYYGLNILLYGVPATKEELEFLGFTDEDIERYLKAEDFEEEIETWIDYEITYNGPDIEDELYSDEDFDDDMLDESKKDSILSKDIVEEVRNEILSGLDIPDDWFSHPDYLVDDGSGYEFYTVRVIDGDLARQIELFINGNYEGVSLVAFDAETNELLDTYEGSQELNVSIFVNSNKFKDLTT